MMLTCFYIKKFTICKLVKVDKINVYLLQECKIADCAEDVYEYTISTTKQPKNKTTQYTRFKRDLVVCTECCYNDTCNVKGCGSSVYGMLNS